MTTELELVQAANTILAEGPVWDPRSSELLWVDIPGGVLHRLDPSSGRDRTLSVGQPLGAVAMREAGGYVVALRDGIALLGDDGELRPIADVEADLPTHRFNDGKCDAAGRFWAGTMRFDEVRGSATLYRVDPDHSVTPMITGVGLSNGLGWSVDGTVMYYIDTLERSIDAFDFAPDTGGLSSRRRLVSLAPDDGYPDGMTVDRDGFLWVALYQGGAIRRYSPAGELARTIDLPVSQPTSCAFGGPDLMDLYITTATQDLSKAQLEAEPLAGGILRCRPGAQGRPENAFQG